LALDAHLVHPFPTPVGAVETYSMRALNVIFAKRAHKRSGSIIFELEFLQLLRRRVPSKVLDVRVVSCTNTLYGQSHSRFE